MQCLQAILNLFSSSQFLNLLCLFAQAYIAYKQWQLSKSIHEYNALSKQANMLNVKLKDDFAIMLSFCKNLVEQLDCEMKEIEDNKSSWQLLSYHYSKKSAAIMQSECIAERYPKIQCQLCSEIKDCLDKLEKALENFKTYCTALYQECNQNLNKRPNNTVETLDNMTAQYDILDAYTRDFEELLRNKTYLLENPQ